MDVLLGYKKSSRVEWPVKCVVEGEMLTGVPIVPTRCDVPDLWWDPGHLPPPHTPEVSMATGVKSIWGGRSEYLFRFFNSAAAALNFKQQLHFNFLTYYCSIIHSQLCLYWRSHSSQVRQDRSRFETSLPSTWHNGPTAEEMEAVLWVRKWRHFFPVSSERIEIHR